MGCGACIGIGVFIGVVLAGLAVLIADWRRAQK